MVGCMVMGQTPQPASHRSVMEYSPAREPSQSEMWYLVMLASSRTHLSQETHGFHEDLCKDLGYRLPSMTLGCRDPCLNNESRAPLPKAGSRLMAVSYFCAR